MKKQMLLCLSFTFLFFSAVSAQNPPKTISGGIINGKAVSLPAPKYPAAARAVKACGSVTVQVIIDEEGKVSSVEVLAGHPLLRNAAEEAAWEAVFRPTELSGQPVKVQGEIVYKFVCEDPADTEVADEPEKADDPDFDSSAADKSERNITGGVLNGKAISLPAPEYPSAARAVKASGSVQVKVLIDEAGNVVSAEAISGHPLLRNAAESAALLARFHPTTLADQPVKVSGVIVYVFDSGQKDDIGSPDDPEAVENSGISSSPSRGLSRAGILNQKAVSLPEPKLPAAAQAADVSGTVSVRVVIDEGGSVIEAEAVSGHPLLRKASEDAALEAKFLPTMLNGAPVKVSGILVYNFVKGDEEKN